MFYKRIIAWVMLSLLVVVSTACTPKQQNIKDCDIKITFCELYVGESVIIEYFDSVILINVGGYAHESELTITNYLKKANINKIDYLIASNFSNENMGNYLEVFNSCVVQNVCIPYITNSIYLNNFTFFSYLQTLNINTIYLDSTFKIIDSKNNFKLCTLSPYSIDEFNGEYDALNQSATINTNLLNNVTAVFYLEYNGLRVLISDAILEDIENKIYNNYQYGLYSIDNINLDNIDYYKPSSTAIKNGASQSFLNLLKPKNIILTTSQITAGSNITTNYLNLVNSLNCNTSIYRMDELGEISLNITKNESKISFNM